MGEASPSPSASPPSLEELRQAIDDLDAQLVGLLNRRAEVVIQIGDLKRQANAQVYTPSRESEVLRHAIGCNEGPLDEGAIRAIFREIMSASIALEHPLKVAYLGPDSTFTHLAAQAKFGSSVEYLPNRDILGIFRSVANRVADLGVVPVENSIDGGIGDTLDAFMEYDLQVCSELLVEVHHCLMARGRQTAIQKVYSKPQVFAQCGRWLSEHYPDAELISVSSTARACEVAREAEDAAAIAHAVAAATYGLEIIHKNIEDVARNVTRFVVLSHESCQPPSGRDKTSVVLSVAHRAGALYEALAPFRDHGINLTRIESRPSKRNPWEYFFFIDFEGHKDAAEVATALGEMHQACIKLQILGSYPAADGTVAID